MRIRELVPESGPRQRGRRNAPPDGARPFLQAYANWLESAAIRERDVASFPQEERYAEGYASRRTSFGLPGPERLRAFVGRGGRSGAAADGAFRLPRFRLRPGWIEQYQAVRGAGGWFHEVLPFDGQYKFQGGTVRPVPKSKVYGIEGSGPADLMDRAARGRPVLDVPSRTLWPKGNRYPGGLRRCATSSLWRRARAAAPPCAPPVRCAAPREPGGGLVGGEAERVVGTVQAQVSEHMPSATCAAPIDISRRSAPSNSRRRSSDRLSQNKRLVDAFIQEPRVT